jgi:hypothetical protein
MGLEGEPGRTIPIIAVKERKTKMKAAAVVPRKTTGAYVAKGMMAFLQEVGLEFGDNIVKCDQEEAIKSVVSDVGRLRAAGGGGRMIVEYSPVGASASNGVIERGIQSIEGQVRVLKDALEARWSVKLPVDHPVLSYLVEYAAVLLNRFEVGKDGRTSLERCKGKKAKTLGIEFGEAVHWRRKPVGGALGKLSVLWSDGVYLGVKGKTGEMVVGTPDGIWKTRTIQRKPVGQRWASSSVDMVRHVPWWSSQDDPEEDGERPTVIRLSPEEETAKKDEQFQNVPRSATITQEDLKEHGFSAKCPGCLAVLRKTARQGHSEECRLRIGQAMAGAAKWVVAKRRRKDFVEEAAKAEEDVRGEKDETRAAGASSSSTGASSSSNGNTVSSNSRVEETPHDSRLEEPRLKTPPRVADHFVVNHRPASAAEGGADGPRR